MSFILRGHFFSLQEMIHYDVSNRHKETIYMDKLNAHNFWSNPHLLKGEDIAYWTNMVNEIGWNNVGALLLMVEYMKMGYSKGMDDEAVMRDIRLSKPSSLSEK